MSKEKESIKKLKEIYPTFKDLFEFLNDIELSENAKKLAKEHNIEISVATIYMYFMAMSFTDENFKQEKLNLTSDKQAPNIHQELIISDFHMYGMLDKTNLFMFQNLYFRCMKKGVDYLCLSVHDFVKKDFDMNGNPLKETTYKYTKNGIRKSLKTFSENSLIFVYNFEEPVTDKTKMVIFFPLFKYENLFEYLDQLDKKSDIYKEFFKACETNTLNDFISKYSLSSEVI